MEVVPIANRTLTVVEGIRKQKHMSRITLAKAVGLPAPRMSAIEKNPDALNTLTPGQLDRLAEVLGIPVEILK